MPNHATTDFSDLMDRVRSGEEEALAELITQYEPAVRRAARALLGPALRPHLDSLDISQSVHFTLMMGFREKRFHIESPEKLVALTATLVRRKVARHWRRLRREDRLEGAGHTAEDWLEGIASLAHPVEDPASPVVYEEEFRRAMNAMSPLERQLVELRLLGHTTAEAARRLGQCPDVLRVRLGRLRKQLREAGYLADWF